MTYSLSIKKWFALSAGLANKDEWLNWSTCCQHDWTLALPKLKKLPAMQARRMSAPSRLAVEVGLTLIENEDIDFIIFVSQHGELERTYKILSALNSSCDISPTDFALSVHNTAAGLLTIISSRAIPVTSISASNDGFQQGLFEAQSLFHQGYKQILLIDFDGLVPDFYHSQIQPVVSAYAAGFIVTNNNDNDMHCVSVEHGSTCYQADYPQSLAFLHAYLGKKSQFTLQGSSRDWQWTIKG